MLGLLGLVTRKKILFAILFIAGCATLPRYDDVAISKGDYTSLQMHLPKIIEYTMSEKDITGLSIAVVDDQTVVYSQGFGYANKKEKLPATSDTLFGIGSVSKIFTALAVMKLVEQGKIDLDKPITTYLTDFSIKKRSSKLADPTVRQLMTHHSGLPSDRMQGFVRGLAGQTSEAELAKAMTYHQLVTVTKDEYANFPPDDNFSYSNFSYSLLGEIVARVSKMPFEEFVEKEILDPTGMRESTFFAEVANTKLLSRGYIGGDERGIPLIRDVPAGQMVASANEMANFLKMIFADGKANDKNVVSRATINEMLRVQNAGIKKDGDFRIGLAFWQLPAGTNIPPGYGHGGDIPPFRALLVTYPQFKIGVVVMVNSLNGSSFDLAQITDVALRMAYEIKTGQKPVEDVSPTRRVASKDELKKYDGLYATPVGVARVKALNDELEVELFGITLRAEPMSNDDFTFYYRIFGLIPLHLDALKPLSIRFHSLNNEPRLQLSLGGMAAFGTAARINPTPVLAQWKTRAGEYKPVVDDSMPAFESFKFLYDEKEKFYFLEMKMSKKMFGGATMRVPLETVNENLAVIMGDGRNLGDTIYVTRENDTEFIHYSGFKLTKSK